MKHFLVRPAYSLEGSIFLPGDKSIAHRALIISAVSNQKTVITNFPANEDALTTGKILKSCGIRINSAKNNPNKVIVFGKGLRGFKKPKNPIFMGNSGTSLRLILGILAGQNFKIKLVAGKSLSKRPMLRVIAPLRKMGAIIVARVNPNEEYPPLTIQGGKLKGINYVMPLASAQVKSAIILAGLYAQGITRIKEPISTRDHTERMLKIFKADIKVTANTIVIKGGRELESPKNIYIPGDISSASFFIVLACLMPKACLLLKNVCLNPTRAGILKVLKRMGADIKVTLSIRQAGRQFTGSEPMGDILVKSSRLKGAVITKNEVPSLIDELPILMVAASLAEGRSVFEGVGELKVKETDRIKSMTHNLTKMGANIEVLNVLNSKIIIDGENELKGCRVSSFDDHRTAMSMIVAGLRAKGSTYLDDISCIDKSFPNFLKILKTLLK